jgi:hypothetical protein
VFPLRRDWLGLVCIVIACLIGVHHLVISGRFFDVDDVLHHEFLMALSGGLGVGIVIGARLTGHRED